MSVNLKYRKKGPGLLKDLQKVFFCSTDVDRVKYFEEISSDLFELQDNISIWYREEDISGLNDEEKKNYLSDLSQMALFVVIVTSDFLKTENDARMLELDFAIKENIPVLPVLEEQGLEYYFNDVCGNLQILNKYDPDPTALPYKDKLKLFLDTVLLKDEMLEKIRKAFAAYIFLSYRKKDRRYAQEVMRLIHADPFTRDIAIWYDEFLTPGEDFNESIKEAFEKSDLFTMVVTPNLLEKPNYVMTTEYPMAIKAEKKILPIKAVETDEKSLAECYPQIPDPINAENGADVVGKLIREALDVKTTDDPLHQFFIGLAYLSGIDMETDHEKARSLITAAAEGGLEEAYEKLVSMYEKGQGVDRDYEQSALYREKYADLLERKLAEGSDDEDLQYRYIRAVNDSAKRWSDLLKYERCWKLLDKMMALDLKGKTNREKIALAETFQYAAEISVRQNELSKAKSYLDRMFEVSEGFIADLRVIDIEKNKNTYQTNMLKYIYEGIGLIIRGAIAVKEKNWNEAMNSYEKAISPIRKVFSSNPAKYPNYARTLVELYGDYSEAFLMIDETSEDNLRMAERKCREGLLFAEGVINQHGDFVRCPYTYKIYKTLVKSYIGLKNYYAAEKTAKEFLALAEKEDREQESINSAQTLAFAHGLLASVAEKKQDYVLAEKEVRAAVEIENSLKDKIGILNAEKTLKSYYQILLNYAKKRGDDKAASFYSDNIRYVDSLVALKYYRDGEKGDVEAAAKAYDLYMKLHEKYPERGYDKNANYVKNHFMNH
ncbi:MAG: toll/interleukin-1 receptor domain-containing protein [Erysipelotrichaceae bacterium]|nr:toll/interleukin-1 receptor domain-containing protein [Erysipelotrichaceae bacterium]